ncbi:MAG: DUF4157 domain-containing protein [Hormoscilla sp. GUM202]|nr:DUF4157 domain-containing protein [Hormoscilla sp. GUM202]
MTHQYVQRTNQSPQEENDSWILQRTAVRELPAKTLTPQTEYPAGDRLPIKQELMQIPLCDRTAQPTPLQAYAKEHNSDAEERVGEKNVAKTQSLRGNAQLGIKGMSVAHGVGERGDRSTMVQRQSEEKKGENKTGLPDRLKEGIERMSGYDLSGVRVNYNSPKPAHLNAHAYTQGQAIEVGPGQERNLPHEAWHVVQQMQGRVKEEFKVNGYGVNGDRGLEREADTMGKRALQMRSRGQ